MATMKEIAKKAGVSISAVSRILNQDASLKVPFETKQKVMEVAKELGYEKKKGQQVRAAFRLGVVCWFSAKEELEDDYYLLVRRGIEEYALKNAVSIVRAFKADEEYASVLEGVDGLICIGKFSEEDVVMFTNICKNILFLDMPVMRENISTMTMDFKKGVLDALAYLEELGHETIAYLGGKEYVGEHQLVEDERRRAYCSYMESKGRSYEELFVEDKFTAESGYEMMKQLIKKRRDVTAVFAASDAIAVGAMKAIHEAGLRVPEDISLIGCNDTKVSQFMTPALTTVHAPAYDMGQHGANLLFGASNLCITTPLKIKVPCYLVKRESCGKRK